MTDPVSVLSAALTGRYRLERELDQGVRNVADPGAGKWQISASGGNEPRWAHRGW